MIVAVNEKLLSPISLTEWLNRGTAGNQYKSGERNKRLASTGRVLLHIFFEKK